MRILMIAPQPFFVARGAPLCVYQHAKVLASLGHKVDLITYPFGDQIRIKGVRIYRAPTLPFLKNIKPGFSLAKFPLDFFVFFIAFWCLLRNKYRYLHTHEEAAFMGAFLAPVFNCKHLYYMHCDLAQIVPSWLAGLMNRMQRFMVRQADAVLAFYPDVTALAKRIEPSKLVFTILPAPVDEDLPDPEPQEVKELHWRLQLGDGPVVLYTGTFEDYQGLDLLIKSIPQVQAAIPDVCYMLVGGEPFQVQRLEVLARELNVSEHVYISERRPLEDMPYYTALANIVVSPRNKGSHVPLKIYTYMRSGKAILATDTRSHTQVLSSEVALLVPPTVESLAEGAITLLQDKELEQRLAQRAQQFAKEHYSWASFAKKCEQVYKEFLDS